MAYNILIVDDSASMRKIIRKTLSLSGFQVGACVEAANGKEALEILQQHPVDLVLSDINMPEMNGVEFLWQLRQDPRWKQLPVVMITTETSEEIVKEAIELGARGYLRKPFRPEQIRSCLTEIMGGPDAEDLARNDEGCDF
ncbi:MAG: two-component system response regulator [Syntrophobacteraceae bacterium CG2_30_61_12]|nr:MAG: two-component system response regulator [Syntrophobacteraceae bacterium CG2_30_61_12]